MRLTARSVPLLTPFGGNQEEVHDAVRLIEEQGDPRTFPGWLARNPKTWRQYTSTRTMVGSLRHQGIVSLIAVEMAVNEENERRALEGELALLEDAWKEAEEIAAISDQLVLPEGIESRLSEITKSRHEAS